MSCLSRLMGKEMNAVEACSEDKSSSSAWNSDRLFSTRRYMRFKPRMWHFLGVADGFWMAMPMPMAE